MAFSNSSKSSDTLSKSVKRNYVTIAISSSEMIKLVMKFIWHTIVCDNFAKRYQICFEGVAQGSQLTFGGRKICMQKRTLQIEILFFQGSLHRDNYSF